jgi:hypothetical protein
MLNHEAHVNPSEIVLALIAVSLTGFITLEQYRDWLKRNRDRWHEKAIANRNAREET